MSKRTRLLLKENNELEQQINQEDREILTDMIVYIRSANISPYYQEVVRRDIWEMIIEGEKRGENLKEVIGEDYKIFCDNVITEIPKLTARERLLSQLRDTLLSVAVLMVIWFMFRLIDQLTGTGHWPYFSFTFGNAVTGTFIIIAAFFIFFYISRHTFDSNVSFSKRNFWFLFGIIFIIMLICTCVNTLVDYSLFQIHAFIAAIVIAAVFILYKILDRKID